MDFHFLKSFASISRVFRRAALGLGLTLITKSGAQTDPAAANLSFIAEGDQLFARWDVGSGGLQLKRVNDLNASVDWSNVPAVLGPDGSWRAEVSRARNRSFYALVPAALPLAPLDVRLSKVRSEFRLDWVPEYDAEGYIVYLGTSPDVGPATADKIFDTGAAGSLMITGLVEGQVYYVSIAAKNAAGTSLPSPAVSGVYGASGPVTGFAAYEFAESSGSPFHVRAAGVVVTLTPEPPTGTLSPRAPTAPMFTVTTDRDGGLVIPDVPEGSYIVNWTAPEGLEGPSAFTLKVNKGGGTVLPLAIPGKPGSLHGRVQFTSGEAASIDDEIWDIHHRASVEMVSKTGDVLASTTADAKGGYALPPPEEGHFPVKVRINYQSLKSDHVISKASDLATSTLLPPILITERPPTVSHIIFKQNGQETKQIVPDVPVEVSAETENPDGLPEDFRWHLEWGNKTYKEQGKTASFTIPSSDKSVPGISSAEIDVRLNVSDLLLTSTSTKGVVGLFIGVPSVDDCTSGLVAEWNPASPNVLTPVHPALITLEVDYSSDPPILATTLDSSGYFEANSRPGHANLIRVVKSGYMRFLGRFDSGLSAEKTFPLISLTTSLHTFTGSPAVFSQPNGMGLGVFGLQTLAGAPYTGSISISTAFFDPVIRNPLPPGAVIDDGVFDNDNGVYGQAAEFYKCSWVEVRDGAGNPLLPTANLLIPSGFSGITPFDLTELAYIQRESDGYYEAAGTAVKDSKEPSFVLPISKNGFYTLARPHPARRVIISPDRSLNFPFDLLIGSSFFPITINGGGELFNTSLPADLPLSFKVLDLKQAPGQHYADPASPLTPTPAFNKRVIVNKTSTLSLLPGRVIKTLSLSLGDSIPSLRTGSSHVTGLDSPDQFLAHPNAINNTLRQPGVEGSAGLLLSPFSEAMRYYAEIRAPEGFYEWKEAAGFPQRFGDPLPGVSPDDYATAYYYNLADLGFARAQTMRVKPGADGQPDVAFYVTNYRRLDDARCGRNAIATVCMDYAYKTDLHHGPSRYTRFYAYSAEGALLTSADLDGAGHKSIPGLCVMCHGGHRFNPEQIRPPLTITPPPPDPDLPPPPPPRPPRVPPSADLGSRFLPFDLESYTFHPAYGVQAAALARMNAAVLKTMPDSTPSRQTAIAEIITAWYGNSNPIASPTTFHANAKPASWPSAATYSAFKTGCRVCHISRDLGTGPNFSTQDDLGGFSYQLCTGLSMPHAQRTWGILWGTKAARNLGDLSAPDLPAILHLHDGGSGGCPQLPR